MLALHKIYAKNTKYSIRSFNKVKQKNMITFL